MSTFIIALVLSWWVAATSLARIYFAGNFSTLFQCHGWENTAKRLITISLYPSTLSHYFTKGHQHPTGVEPELPMQIFAHTSSTRSFTYNAWLVWLAKFLYCWFELRMVSNSNGAIRSGERSNPSSRPNNCEIRCHLRSHDLSRPPLHEKEHYSQGGTLRYKISCSTCQNKTVPRLSKPDKTSIAG
jgi:hypothetical protein